MDRSNDVDAFLAHFGIKGMHWGVRRDKPGATKVAVNVRPGKKVKTSGGERQAPNKDAIDKAKSKQKAEKSTTDSLSTAQLQQLVKRMQLEQQYEQLRQKEPSKFTRGKDTVDQILGVVNTLQQIYSVINSPLGKQIRKTISEAVKNR